MRAMPSGSGERMTLYPSHARSSNVPDIDHTPTPEETCACCLRTTPSDATDTSKERSVPYSRSGIGSKKALGTATGGPARRTDVESVSPCFTPGTRIKTLHGEVRIEKLEIGDKVLTRDNGFQPIRWIGTHKLSRACLALKPQLNPIEISANALGRDVPERTMRVSPQHLMLIDGHGAEVYFGTEEVLVAAAHLTCLPGIRRVEPETVTYIHVLFDRHEIVLADGAWTESYQPADQNLAGLNPDAREEIFALFPELETFGHAARHYPAARMSVEADEAELLFL